MKVVKAGKGYINYGLIPKNEYAAANSEKDTASAVVLKLDPQLDDAAYEERLPNQQALHRSDRRNIRGWTRVWKVNGWRAEAASKDDELTGMESYSDYIQKGNRAL